MGRVMPPPKTTLPQEDLDHHAMQFLDPTRIHNPHLFYFTFITFYFCLQRFDVVGWAAGRASGL